MFETTKQIIGYVRFKLKYPNVELINSARLGNFYSQIGQDLYITSFLFPYLEQNIGETKYILDIGCSHPKKFSNTFLMEKYFGCNTITIEPIIEYQKLWEQYRPSACFENCALGSYESKETLNVVIDSNQLHFFPHDMFSHLDRVSRYAHDSKVKQRKIDVERLSNILDRHEVRKSLFCSIDVEGSEIGVLEGIDFNRHFICSFCIENYTDNYMGDERIRGFLKSKGYVFVARFGHLDDFFVHESFLWFVSSLLLLTIKALLLTQDIAKTYDREQMSKLMLKSFDPQFERIPELCPTS